MMLDDVYGSDQDRFPLEQESKLRPGECPTLEWDESEIVLDEAEIRTLTWDLGGPTLSVAE
jgi:hypothetical protein